MTLRALRHDAHAKPEPLEVSGLEQPSGRAVGTRSMLSGIDGQPALPQEAGAGGDCNISTGGPFAHDRLTERHSVAGLGEIWSLIDIVLAWSVIAPEFLGVPILLAGRYPG